MAAEQEAYVPPGPKTSLQHSLRRHSEHIEEDRKQLLKNDPLRTEESTPRFSSIATTAPTTADNNALSGEAKKKRQKRQELKMGSSYYVQSAAAATAAAAADKSM